MTSLFRRFLFTVLGITFVVFGVYYATTSYPEPKAFALVSRELPTIGAVASFYSGIALVILGLALLLLVNLNLRRSQPRDVPALPPVGVSRPRPDREDEDWDPDADPYRPDPDNDYDRGRRGGYDPYDGMHVVAANRNRRSSAMAHR